MWTASFCYKKTQTFQSDLHSIWQVEFSLIFLYTGSAGNCTEQFMVYYMGIMSIHAQEVCLLFMVISFCLFLWELLFMKAHFNVDYSQNKPVLVVVSLGFFATHCIDSILSYMLKAKNLNPPCPGDLEVPKLK